MNRGIIVNLTVIQIGWFIAVLGAAREHAWPGAMFAAVVVMFYLIGSRQRVLELVFVLASACLGFTLDSSLVRLDLVRFAASWPSDSMGPIWTLGLWALLATAFSRSMGWLNGRPTLAAAIAPIAPLTYWAGARLGAAEFPQGLTGALIGIGVGWGIALPLLASLAARILPVPGTDTGDCQRPPECSTGGRERTF